MLNTIKQIKDILDDKKAIDIKILEVEGLTSLTEYLVLATGTSSTHVKALAGYVEETLKDNSDIKLHHSEGYGDTGWVLLDFGSVLVNIFERETRENYSLEKLWENAKSIEI